MDSGFILLALIIASLPFVLPIVSLVRQSGLRKRLAALENALGDQKHNIDDLEGRLTQLKRDGVAAAPPLASHRCLHWRHDSPWRHHRRRRSHGPR